MIFHVPGAGLGCGRPICAWADENTGASVGFVTPETTQQKPASVDLAAFAEATLNVRAEARQPIG
ncbi:hypothetical protein ACFCX3_06660 [Streptomyces virginiae]|uniref:hypothetical protein n=1 Tax=Streptomyces virginiae TaxID=1961 RepID=UPI0035E2C722